MKVIEVENLTKEYSLGSIGHGTLSKDLQSLWAKWRGKEDPNSKIGKSELNNENRFLALDNISFSVEKGDRLGIIGKNGAGKSTLLKILSRVINPTKGKVKIKGRMASLLEVGTGFHPELSGRDNIYLNGAILGMSRIEISSKFDEIVEFSDLSKFIDTPVKRYSSGMYVRLAFAVAAHLDPEILVIDEVLAVGDYTFQKKCLGKMEDLNEKEGRTIIFVSHDMNVISKFCNDGIYLDKGKIISQSKNINIVISNYYSKDIDKIDCIWVNTENKYYHKNFQPTKFYLGNSEGTRINLPIDRNNDIFIYLEGIIGEESDILQVGYELFDEKGVLIFQSIITDGGSIIPSDLKKGYCKFKTKLPNLYLNQGEYLITLLVILHYKEFILNRDNSNIELKLEIKSIDFKTPFQIQKRIGLLTPVVNWKLN